MKRVRVVLLATHVPGPHEARARCGRRAIHWPPGLDAPRASRVLRRRAAVRVGVMSFAAPGAGKPATVSR